MVRGYKELHDPDTDTAPLREHDVLDQSRARSNSVSSRDSGGNHRGAAFYNKEDVELEDLLRTNPLSGLSSEEASQRLRTYGPNELPEVKRNRLLRFLGYFVGPIAFLIELACIISVIVKVLECDIQLSPPLTLVFLASCLGFFR